MTTKTIIILAIALVTTVFVLLKTAISKKKLGEVKNESDSWKWGIIYYNPSDSRIFLPKRTGLGVTLNFANPLSLIILVGIIVISLIFS